MNEKHLPNILLRSALCKSGFSSANFFRSTLAQTINAFIGRRMRASFALFRAFAALILPLAAPPPPPPALLGYDCLGNIPNEEKFEFIFLIWTEFWINHQMSIKFWQNVRWNFWELLEKKIVWVKVRVYIVESLFVNSKCQYQVNLIIISIIFGKYDSFEYEDFLFW